MEASSCYVELVYVEAGLSFSGFCVLGLVLVSVQVWFGLVNQAYFGLALVGFVKVLWSGYRTVCVGSCFGLVQVGINSGSLFWSCLCFCLCLAPLSRSLV
ncbi:hypothetical protein NE237_030741 [Protea cynaroides]|uniref:Uncharacterized protein n=1 Tax=Protea cynaroides TaxID=273540 RepID=A0A9Q0GUP9_9MAGN|nr:hypothetical protein NE237_030741 [Protea cynaroides]